MDDARVHLARARDNVTASRNERSKAAQIDLLQDAVADLTMAVGVLLSLLSKLTEGK